MVPTLEALGLDQLCLEDRLAIAEALWDSVAQEAEASPLSETQRAELSRDQRGRSAGRCQISTTSGVRNLGAADTSVRATSAAATLFLRVS